MKTKSHPVNAPSNRKDHRPRILITMGDPCGVGPEVIVKSFASGAFHETCLPVVVGSPLAIHRAVKLLGTPFSMHAISSLSELENSSIDPFAISVLPVRDLASGDMEYGRPTRATCEAVIESIQTAVHAVQSGKADAVCTCPVHKAHLHRHGFPFPGHTELLQDLTNAPRVVMMLAGPRLRVSLATIHEPLAHVPGLIDRERLLSTIVITGEALVRDFGLHSPHIAVAALNPHAGEEGRFGREEIDVIAPAIQELAGRIYRVSGPYPPDTLFHRAYQGEFDAVVSMYHDQGLIPIKLVHFHDAVNVSLGLPIIRTSVDHGTAYDLAGTGRAHPGSLLAAVRLAADMARNRSAAGPPLQ